MLVIREQITCLLVISNFLFLISSFFFQIKQYDFLLNATGNVLSPTIFFNEFHFQGGKFYHI